MADDVVRAVGAVRRDLDAALAEHPASEELAQYVDGALDAEAREFVALHVDGCDACRAEVADLEALKQEIASGAGADAAATSSSTWLALAASIAIVASGTILATRWWGGFGPPPAPVAVTRTPAPTGGLEKLTPADRAVVNAVIASQRVALPAIVGQLTVDTGALMGGVPPPNTFAVVAPVARVVDSDRPTFRWTAATGAASYEVTVLDAQLNGVMTSGPVTALEWTTEAPLPRGSVLTWQVAATTSAGRLVAPSPPAPEARLAILDSVTAEAMTRARDTYAGSHLALGVLAAQAGLLDEAEREFAALAAQQPASPLAAALLQQIRTVKR